MVMRRYISSMNFIWDAIEQTWEKIQNFWALIIFIVPIFLLTIFCSDFRFYESNGIFALGWGFFLQTNFDFLTSNFWQIFFISFKTYCWLVIKLKRYFTCDRFLQSYGCLKIAILFNLGQQTRDIFGFYMVVGRWLSQRISNLRKKNHFSYYI